MQKPESLETPVGPSEAPPQVIFHPPTPLSWRLAILAGIAAVGLAAYFSREVIGLRGQAVAGIIFFFGIVAAFSSNLRAVNWKTIFWGIMLQLALAIAVLRIPFVYHGFEALGLVVKQFIGFSNEGAKFVFGNLYDARPPDAGGTWSVLFGTNYMFQFAFVALPPILFVSAFFTVLYHFGILQWCVRMLAVVMVHLMGTSGAETLSVAANVFMGQTEAPLIVKPYVPRMTNSELFVLMASGMAHISGRHDGRLHQLRRRSGRRADDLRDGLPVQPVPVQVVSAGGEQAGNGRHGSHEEGKIAVRQRDRRRRCRHAPTACGWP